MKHLLFVILLSPSVQSQTATSNTVRNEAPAYVAPVAGSAIPTWTLAHTPYAGVSCFRNGLHQSPIPTSEGSPDYTLTGNVIVSPYWEQGDDILCDYEYLAGQ